MNPWSVGAVQNNFGPMGERRDSVCVPFLLALGRTIIREETASAR